MYDIEAVSGIGCAKLYLRSLQGQLTGTWHRLETHSNTERVHMHVSLHWLQNPASGSKDLQTIYVCMYECMYVCVYVCMCACVSVSVYVYM